ncbi:hypothetical protein Tsubulata_040197 [Turnera subulata]|uniref:DC1 domain-containing protein n=1 Tax=Turnera subulata TaxID=218843 RepID=A0A9Q0J5V3_9ROSI|nr:hypothetical protein Tsubulata_040197 [Turnera subulata]
MGIKHWTHEHGLKLVHVSELTEVAGKQKSRTDCSRCYESIHDRAYLCEHEDCGFMLDESCFGLSENQELLHPLHPDHPLLLISSPPWIRAHICDGCSSICPTFIFQCKRCDFTLDVQCALSKENQGRRKLEVAGDDDQLKKSTTIQHFSHPHSLRLFNCRWYRLRCRLCSDWVKGPAYGCVECEFYHHISCAEFPLEIQISCAEFPLEIQHPYHPENPLRASATTPDVQWSSRCKACRLLVGLAVYQCRPCGLALHMICANQTLLSSPLKSECHQHNLYYIIGSDDDEGDDEEEETDDGEEDDTNRGSDDGEEEDEENDDGKGEDTDGTTSDDQEDQDPDQKSHKEQCNACNKYCVKSYYQCLECKYIIHLKCMGLPATVDYSCHLHLLTLVEKFVEDDSGVYYCHACGQERNPKYPVYVCKECSEDVPFAAHIEYIPFNSGQTVSEDPAVESYPALVEFDEAKRKPKCKVQIEVKVLGFESIALKNKWQADALLEVMMMKETMKKKKLIMEKRMIVEKMMTKKKKMEEVKTQKKKIQMKKMMEKKKKTAHYVMPERNPEYPVYLCKECPDDVPFAAHIECVVSEETDIPFISGVPLSDDNPVVESYPALVEFDEAKRKPKCKFQIEIKDFKNYHALTFVERGTTLGPDEACYGCRRSVRGSRGYAGDINFVRQTGNSRFFDGRW